VHEASESANDPFSVGEQKSHPVCAQSAGELTLESGAAEETQQRDHETVSKSSPTGFVAREEELRRQLVENESQLKEITGYVNQLNIQIHRWQLRLQKLNERNANLKTQLGVLKGENPA
jgi:chromosome segregation ATPase